MMILITYDIKTDSSDGQYRLRKVAGICKDYGQRVQNSVFECLVNPVQLIEIKNKLIKIMDLNQDSIRIYHMGSSWCHKIEHFGTKVSYNPEGTMII